jgi:hypothetical protein
MTFPEALNFSLYSEKQFSMQILAENGSSGAVLETPSEIRMSVSAATTRSGLSLFSLVRRRYDN